MYPGLSSLQISKYATDILAVLLHGDVSYYYHVGEPS